MFVARHAELYQSSDLILDRDALIEQRGTWRYIYGRWDRVFGAWQQGADGIARAFLPPFSLFQEDGEPWAGSMSRPSWEDPYFVALPYDDEVYWGYAFGACKTEDRSTLNSFAALIPHETRLIVAPLHRPESQWLALAAMWVQPALGEMLRAELSTVGSGYVETCFALSGLTAGSPSVAARFLRDALTSARAKFLSNLTGRSVRPAAARLLSKLTRVGHISSNVIDLIWGTNTEPEWVRSLAHTRQVPFWYLAFLADVAPEFRHAKCLRYPSRVAGPSALDIRSAESALDEEGGSEFDITERALAGECLSDIRVCLAKAEQIYRTLQMHAKELPGLWETKLHAEIARAETASALYALIRDKFEEYMPTQYPPWEGNAIFRPINSAKELRRAALRFRNCACGRWAEVLERNTAIYVTEKPPEMMIEVCRNDPFDPWRLGDHQFLDGDTDWSIEKLRLQQTFVRAFNAATGAKIRLPQW